MTEELIALKCDVIMGDAQGDDLVQTTTPYYHAYYVLVVPQGLFALMSLCFAYLLMRLDIGRANPVFRFASLASGVLSAAFIVFGLGIVENPLLNSDYIQGVPVFSSLMLAYLVPVAVSGRPGRRSAPTGPGSRCTATAGSRWPARCRRRSDRSTDRSGWRC